MGVCLPVEIIDIILCHKNLSIADVSQFMLINRYYYAVVRSSTRIWKQKYFQTWPQFSEVLDENNFNYDWYTEVQYIYRLKQRTREILSLMPSRLYNLPRQCCDSDFTEWLKLYNEKPQTYYYLVDDLMSIVNTHTSIDSLEVVAIATPGNRTLQFYAIETLRYLRKLHLTKEWKSLPQKQKTLEKGGALIMQWYRPNVDIWKKFSTQLDRITSEVKEYLKMIYPNHPLFSVSKEKLQMWRNANIKGHKYRNMYCKQILRVFQYLCYLPGFFCAIEDVIKIKMLRFNTLFYKMKQFLEATNMTDIILMIVYEGVARRLGLKCQVPTQFSTQNRLHFSHEYDVEDDDCSDTNTYGLTGDLPVSETMVFLKLLATKLQEQYNSYDAPDKYAWQFMRMSSLPELVLLVDPCNRRMAMNLLLLYVDMNANCRSFIDSFVPEICQLSETQQFERIMDKLKEYQGNRISGDYSPKGLKAKVRSLDLKYAVGMVMNYVHPRSQEKIVCVICDWDPACWAMHEQPLYTVLLPSGSYDDVPQDKLEPIASKTTKLHLLRDIGIHFSHMFGKHYVPNAEKECEYPSDTAVRQADCRE